MKLKRNINFSEPRAVKKHFYQYPIPFKWSHIFFVVFMILIICIGVFIRKEDPVSEKLLITAFIGLLGALTCYGIPIIDQFTPGTISITGVGIERNDTTLGVMIPILFLLRYRRYTWKWSEISRIDISEEVIQQKSYRVLFGDTLPPFESADLKELEATRHLIVHRSGIVDEKFAQRSRQAVIVGQAVDLSGEIVFNYGTAVIGEGVTLLTHVDNAINRTESAG